MNIIKTIKSTDTQKIKALFSKLYIPPLNSHKGQNGKLLVIGGSSLFHGASIWAAEIASYVVDMVHYSSTVENNQIMLSLKKKFQNGNIVPRNQLDSYVNEDDSILIGSGMIRKEFRINNLELRIKDLGKLSDAELERSAKQAKERKEEFESGLEEGMKKKYYVK